MLAFVSLTERLSLYLLRKCYIRSSKKRSLNSQIKPNLIRVDVWRHVSLFPFPAPITPLFCSITCTAYLARAASAMMRDDD